VILSVLIELQWCIVMHVIQCSVNLYMRWLAAAAADTGSAAECRFLPNQDGDVARIRRYQ